MNLHALIEARARLWEATKAKGDELTKDGRSMSADESAGYDKMHDDLNEMDTRIDEAVALEKRNEQAEEIAKRYSVKPPAEDNGPAGDEAMVRRMAAGQVRGFDFKPEARDLTKGTATAGGNTVPTSFWGMLQEHLIENSAIRQSNVTVISTASGEDLQVPKTTTHPTAGIIAEGALITESDAAFGQLTLGAFKYAFSTQISSELEQDAGVDLMGYLARIGGEALSNGSGAHFVTGTGSGQPNGIVTASTLGVTGATAATGAFLADELIDLYFSVIGPYRNRGTWMMSDAGMKMARKLKDGDNQYLWAPGLVAGEQNTLLGRPVVNDTNVADPAVGAKSVIFGDFSRYMIRDVAGVRVERSADFAFNTDLVTWRFIARTDGDLVDLTGAVKHFIGAAA